MTTSIPLHIYAADKIYYYIFLCDAVYSNTDIKSMSIPVFQKPFRCPEIFRSGDLDVLI